MPYDAPEPDDPQVLVGVLLDGNEDTMREMAVTVVDEFARMGHGREEILALFQSPAYGGAHAAYKALGEAAIVQIVDESLGVWGALRVTVQDAAEPPDRSEASGINVSWKRPDR